MKLKIGLLIFCLTVYSCKKNDTTSSVDIQETAQQIGDVMASVDESGGSSGGIASLENSVHETFARYAPGELDRASLASILIPQAQAASCSGSGFSGCSANVIIRNFAGCTVGSAIFTGSTTLTWGGTSANCVMGAVNDTITRVPNFTVTGRRNATLAVSKTGTLGQRLTWASGAGPSRILSFSNDGINRKFTAANSQVIFDQTTTTTSPITVTGSARSNRILSGGALRVTNNLSNVSCDYVPSAVTWNTASCNCPVSGSWAGSCTDGKSTSLTITGCGTGTYSEGTDSESVTFDRCGT